MTESTSNKLSIVTFVLVAILAAVLYRQLPTIEFLEAIQTGMLGYIILMLRTGDHAAGINAWAINHRLTTGKYSGPRED